MLVMEHKIIIGGLAVFLLAVLFPFFWNNIGETPMPKAMVNKISEELCVFPVTQMRASHMQLLDEWREDVVRRGNRQFVTTDGRTFEKSLSKTCMECHSLQQCEDCHHTLNVQTYCWDCHVLPDMSSRYARLYTKLQDTPFPHDPQTRNFHTINFKPIHDQLESLQSSGKGQGQLMPGASVSLISQKGEALHVSILGWQQDQVNRVIYSLQGKRVFTAVLRPTLIEKIQIIESMMDPETELTWHRVELEVWLSKSDLIPSKTPLWEFAEEMFSNSCTACHSGTEPDHHLANQWLGHLKSMKRFISLDRVQYYILLNYLQFHSRDVVHDYQGIGTQDSIKQYP